MTDAAIAQRHEVGALVRDRSRAALPAGVELREGDVLKPASVTPALWGRDAVICALGTASPRKPSTLLRDGTANLVAVMRQAKVARLICVSLLGLGQSRQNASLFYRVVILRVLAPMIPDKQAQKDVVRGRASLIGCSYARPGSPWAGQPDVCA